MGDNIAETGKSQSPRGPEDHSPKLRFYIKCNRR